MTKVRSVQAVYQAGRATVREQSLEPVRAKVFANGRSQAVRLPKAMRVTCAEVFIRQEGEMLILEPVPEPPCDAKGWRLDLWEDLAQWRTGLDPEEFQLEDDPVPEPLRPVDAG